jgi:hypothetical protein
MTQTTGHLTPARLDINVPHGQANPQKPQEIFGLISKMDGQCIRRLLPKRIACGVSSFDVQFRDVIVH